MSRPDDDLREALARLRSADLERDLAEPSGIDFSSNDYLGLAKLDAFHERLAEKLATAPHGSPASRLVRGNLPIHRALERELAAFKGTEDALLFPTGYQANIGLVTAILGPDDRVISDELNHASIIDGIRLTRAERVIVPHLDIGAIESALRAPQRRGRSFVVTESLFSMDGDIARLDRYADLCDEHGAGLIVDDAHATGLFGDARGSGLVERFGIERRAFAIVSTFGKALGFFGAFVAGSEVLIRWLVNSARSFIFTTAPPPALVLGVETSLELLRAHPERRQRVLGLADRFRATLAAAGIDTRQSAGPIVPVILGENARALAIAADLRRRGFDVRAIRPPSVAPGSARLRICVHADHREEDIDALSAALAELIANGSGAEDRGHS